MALKDYNIICSATDILADGDIIKFRSFIAGTIKEIHLLTDEANTDGDNVFNLNHNGSDLWSSGARPKIAQNDEIGSKTGLNIAVGFGDKFILQLESMATGGVKTNLQLQIIYDDGVPSGGAVITNVISDNFNDNSIDTTNIWNTPPAGYTESGGKMNCNATSSADLRSKNKYSFHNKMLSARVYPHNNGIGSNHHIALSIDASPTSSANSSIDIFDGQVRAFFNGSQTRAITYNAAVHLYLRMVCMSGGMAFQWSTDGVNYTTFCARGAVNSVVDDCYFLLAAYNGGAGAVTRSWDDLKLESISLF